jgi:hypothetical protein
MATLGLELCDAGFLTALSSSSGDPQVVNVTDQNGANDWPGFAYSENNKLFFGRTAEDNWFVHPRRVVHTFWARLAHEPSTLPGLQKPPSFSELSFFFLRDYVQRLRASADKFDQIVVAVPGAYLKDEAAEDEKIGLLLGMADELKLPLAGFIDMGCAALCDPRAGGFNPALPVVVLDLHLEGADITLFTTDERLERRDFIHVPQFGVAHLLKHLTGTMGNRFLRHTAFDILEDGRIEQMFFRQTKEFLVGDAPECRYHINTSTRGYEMIAKREQLAADANAFVLGVVHSVQTFIKQSPHASEPCTLALSERSSHVPGLESRLRAAGFTRIIRLPRGAAAAGAARIGSARLTVPADLGDVPVERGVALAEARRSVAAQWEARLQKNKLSTARIAPTHAILEGIGHPISPKPRFTIGLADLGADLPLPEAFSSANDCSVPLVNDQGRLWFVDGAGSRNEPSSSSRVAIDAGDRLTVRCGGTSAEILFAHVPSLNGHR